MPDRFIWYIGNVGECLADSNFINMEEIHMAHPVTHFEIQTKNSEKIQKFYKDLFAWKIQVVPEMAGYGMVDTGAQGQGAGFGIGPIMPGGKQMVTFYVDVASPKAYMDKAVKLGGKVVIPPTSIPGVTYGLFADPDGNVIGVAKFKRAARVGAK